MPSFPQLEQENRGTDDGSHCTDRQLDWRNDAACHGIGDDKEQPASQG